MEAEQTACHMSRRSVCMRHSSATQVQQIEHQQGLLSQVITCFFAFFLSCHVATMIRVGKWSSGITVAYNTVCRVLVLLSVAVMQWFYLTLHVQLILECSSFMQLPTK